MKLWGGYELESPRIVLHRAEKGRGSERARAIGLISLIFVNCLSSAPREYRCFIFRGTFSGPFSPIPFKAWKRKSAEEWNFTFTRLAIRRPRVAFPWKQKLGVVRNTIENWVRTTGNSRIVLLGGLPSADVAIGGASLNSVYHIPASPALNNLR